MITRHSINMLRVLIMALCLSTTVAATDDNFDIDIHRIVAEVERRYESFRAIPHLNIDFEMNYELVAGAPQFAFDRLQVTTIETAGKRRLHIVGYAGGIALVDREYAWNGTKGTSKEVSPGFTQGDYAISSRRDNGLHHYNYYLGFLRFPDMRTPPLPISGITTSTIEYLPGILRRHLDSLLVTWSQEIIGHSKAIRVELPGVVVFWFDPDRNYSLIRQDQFSPKSKKQISSTIYSNHKLLRNFSFPMSIVHEEFAVFDSHVNGVDEPGLVPGALRSRKRLNVNRIEDTPTEADDFVIAAPDGYRVHDLITRQSYVLGDKAEDRFVESAKKIRDMQLPKSKNRALRFGFIALIPVVSLLAIHRYCRKSAR